MKRLTVALFLLIAVGSGVVLLARLGAEASPATFTVDSTGDGGDSNTADGVCDDGSGNCTLRAAIDQANADAGTDTIEFDISGVGPHTISPGSALPTITDPVIIDGTSEPDFAGTPIIELDGSGAGPNRIALNITAGNSTVKGLVINRFSLQGIILSTNGGNVIQGNYIGTEVNGTADLGNGSYGVWIADAPDNIIGGTSEEARNVISGNGDHGLMIQYSGATGNVVQGNYIGTDVTGTLDLGNSQDGVRITGGPSYNTIGGTAAGAGNLISGNGFNGIVIQFSGTTENVVQGNLIGTDITGTAALANAGEGVFIVDGASTNHVGGTEAGARNLISGNNSWGVTVQTGGGNEVQGNLIGTDINGTAALANSGGGVLVQSADNTIGGTTVGARNVISGNGVGPSQGWGVVVQTTGATGNVVQGNYIGTDITGTLDLGNLQDGLSINLGATNNIIGGTDPGAGNVVSGNDRYGVYILDSGTTGNQAQGNYIGTDATGTLDVGNSSVGVLISLDAANNTIGGTASGAANTIAFNGDDGVYVWGTTTTGNTISANSIHSNGGKGIENTNGGNTELAPPAVDSAGSVSGHTDPKCYPCTVEVFSDDEDEGRIYHGSTTTNDDATGTWSYPGAVTGPNVTATITDASGNTSEFSAPATLPVGGIAELPDVAESDSVAGNYILLAALAAAGLIALTAAAWYARREGPG